MSSQILLESSTECLGKKRFVKRFSPSGNHSLLKRGLDESGVATVCREARCPNISECFMRKEVTFMILGAACTRKCGFCAVKKGNPGTPDGEEPRRIADFISRFGIEYAVITSVTRDDLPDRGFSQFANTVNEIRKKNDVPIEILTPDFKGLSDAADRISELRIDVFGHNIETAPRLYVRFREGADFKRSLGLLGEVKKKSKGRLIVKSSFMLGIGESEGEVAELLRDLKHAGCDVVTIGQYLRPDRGCLPASEYISAERFEDVRRMAENVGLRFVLTGPFVRSSYKAHEVYRKLKVLHSEDSGLRIKVTS